MVHDMCGMACEYMVYTANISYVQIQICAFPFFNFNIYIYMKNVLFYCMGRYSGIHSKLFCK